MFIIKDFPLPPSVNKYLMPVAGKVKWKDGQPYAEARLVKTGEHRDYASDCILWSLKYRTGLQKIKADLNKLRVEMESRGELFALRIEAFVCLRKDKIFSTGGKIERIDSDNFLKPLQDNFFSVLGIDDKYVFPTSIEKCFIDDGAEECVIIKVSLAKPRSMSEALHALL